jgi:hypothetical protein
VTPLELSLVAAHLADAYDALGRAMAILFASEQPLQASRVADARTIVAHVRSGLIRQRRRRTA